MTESQGHAYLKDHTLSADALLLDLKEQSTAILGEARAAPNAHAARTLVKDGPLRLTLIGFDAGGALKEHKAGGPVAFQLLQGEVEISTGAGVQTLTQGRCLVLGANVEHSVTAREPAVILLTIAMP